MPSGQKYPENCARRLQAGEHLTRRAQHTGMAFLKAELGEPRPEGMELSLVSPTSPYSYWSIEPDSRGVPKATRLSTRPGDYVWETREENGRRNRPQLIELFLAGLVDRQAQPVTI